jgi:hypothetical protein
LQAVVRGAFIDARFAGGVYSASALPWSNAVATIIVAKIDHLLHDRAEVILDVRTSVGKLVLPITMGREDTAEAYENEAKRQLRILCEEILGALE